MEPSQHVTRSAGPAVPPPALPVPPKPEPERPRPLRTVSPIARFATAPWLFAGGALFLALVLSISLIVVVARSRQRIEAAERAAVVERVATTSLAPPKANEADQRQRAVLEGQLRNSQLQVEQQQKRAAGAEAEVARLRLQIAARPLATPNTPIAPARPPSPVSPQPSKPTPPPLDERGTLVYDFSARNQLNDFSMESGSWEIQDGTLVGLGRNQINIRLKKRLEGSFRVTWDQTVEEAKELGKLGPKDEVHAGIWLGDEGAGGDHYWAVAWVHGNPPGANNFENAFDIHAKGLMQPGRSGFGTVTHGPTRVRGKALQLGQTYQFQLDVDYEQGTTKVRLNGEGWKLENGRAFEIQPHYLHLRAQKCRVKFDNLRIAMKAP